MSGQPPTIAGFDQSLHNPHDPRELHAFTLNVIALPFV